MIEELLNKIEGLLQLSDVYCHLSNPVVSDSGNVVCDMSVVVGCTDMILVLDYAKEMVSSQAGRIDIKTCVHIPSSNQKGVFYNHNYYREQEIKQYAEKIAEILLA